MIKYNILSYIYKGLQCLPYFKDSIKIFGKICGAVNTHNAEQNCGIKVAKIYL